MGSGRNKYRTQRQQDALAWDYLRRKALDSDLTYVRYLAETGHEKDVNLKTFGRWVKSYAERKDKPEQVKPWLETDSPLSTFGWQLLAVFLAHFLIYKSIWADPKKKSDTTLRKIFETTRRFCTQRGIDGADTPEHDFYRVAGFAMEIWRILPDEGRSLTTEILHEHRYFASYRGQKAQTDTTEFSFLIIPKGGGAPVKAFLTTVVCLHSSVIFGWHVHLRHANAIDALLAVYCAIRAKVDPEFPWHAVPLMLQADNGVFDSWLFRAVCKSVGIHVVYTTPGNPTENGCVEKKGGDVKRNIIFKLDQFVVASTPSIGGSSTTPVFHEEEALVAIRDAIIHLNTMRFSGPSCADKWRESPLPPLALLVNDDQEIRERFYVPYFDTRYEGDRIFLPDGRTFTSTALPAYQHSILNVREWIGEPRRPLVALIHNGFSEQILGPINPSGSGARDQIRIAHRFAASPQRQPLDVKRAAAPTLLAQAIAPQPQSSAYKGKWTPRFTRK